MSYDFALQKICSHEIRMENGLYDYVTGAIRFGTPPSNQRVTVWVDGVKVPPAGLWSYAMLVFTNPGPYRINRGQNDLLYVKIGNEPPTFVQLLTGNVPATDLVKDLTLKIPALNFSTTRGRVVIQSRVPLNGTAFTFVDPRWTDKTQSLPTTVRTLAAYSRLGVIPGRVATGRMLFPPWTIEKNELSSWDMDKIVQFHGQIPNQKPVVQLSYVTYPTYCRRCGGTRVEFDYNVMGGTYETVSDADLLAQEFDKFMYTRLGSHWKWTWLGSKLIDRIGGKGATGNTSISAMLSMDVNQAFAVYQNIKMQQSQNSPAQQVSDAEYPLSLRSINVATLPDDPTAAIISISLVCRSLTPVTLNRIVGNPNPYTIGSNLGLATNPAAMISANPAFLLRG